MVCWKNPATHFLLHLYSSLDADQVSDLLSIDKSHSVTQTALQCYN